MFSKDVENGPAREVELVQEEVAGVDYLDVERSENVGRIAADAGGEDFGPVLITDRGRPSHVLLTFEAYEKLLGVDVLERLSEPAGVEDV